MGEMAQRHADGVVVTSDNPRGEDPDAIIAQILGGMAPSANLHSETDRAAAIAQVLAQAGAKDVVLIAGKGHEEYQETAGVKRAFSDMAEARAALAAREGMKRS
ncbi:UDP-N-acetylmuramoyl-L-alanyl-D-glutamate--2,6-diaminopimelate ligase [compost metagenome]